MTNPTIPMSNCFRRTTKTTTTERIVAAASSDFVPSTMGYVWHSSKLAPMVSIASSRSVSCCCCVLLITSLPMMIICRLPSARFCAPPAQFAEPWQLSITVGINSKDSSNNFLRGRCFCFKALPNNTTIWQNKKSIDKKETLILRRDNWILLFMLPICILESS